MTIETEVAIVGAGVAGCATALYLAQRRIPVVVLEKGVAGAQASGVNFGGVRQQGRLLPELPLARRSREIWPRLASIIGDDCEFVASGHLKLARDDADCEELAAYAEAARDHGLVLELLDGGQTRRRFPWLSGAVAGASFCAEDGQANPRLVGPAYGRAARAAGADLREGAKVTGFTHDGQAHDGRGFELTTADGHVVRARQMVNCAGAWGGTVAAAFDETVPLTAIAPQMVVSEPTGHFIEPALGMCGAGIYLRQIARGNVVFGSGSGIADPAASRSYVLPEHTLAAGALAASLIPRLANLQIIRVWTGIEGEMADALPVIGPSRTTPGLWHAFGFSGHGFQLGPAMGEILGELLTTGETPTPIDAFRIDRFAEA